MKRINITDITLKKLASEREVSLLFREKTAIADCADSLGADAVELAPVKNVREDAIIYKTISQNVQNSIVAIPVGFTAEEVSSAWECIKEANKPRLQVELPVSTVQMEYIYHLKADKMLTKITELCSEAKKLCGDVEFSALDATRADRDFLISAVKAAVSAGAGLITLCDDAGATLPEEMAELVKTICAEVSVPVYVKPSDAISMAVANAFSAISAGASGVKAAVTGEGVLSVTKLSDAITEVGETLGISSNVKNTGVRTGLAALLKKINHDEYVPSSSAEDKDSILIDSDSTLSEVCDAVSLLGYDLSDEDSGKVYKELMRLCERKSSVSARELEAVIASTAMQAPSTYHLESYTTSCGNLTSSMSQVVLKRGEEEISGVAIGDGPIDSVFRAIEQSIGFHYELDDFQIQSVTEGKEALGSAVVRLRNNGKLYSGNGISTDIVGASIRAYVNALNKIVFEEA